ncbi:MAG: hypothetical protein ACRDU8_06470 [Egibacteraceae bacterium]
MTVLVGGVSQLYQGDLDLGRIAVERLAAEPLGHGVMVEDLHYGAVAVAQRLEELEPEALILIGAETRGRPPGTVQRRRIRTETPSPAQVRDAVAEAVQGYVGIDLVVEVGAGLDVLPARTVTVEVEPARTDPCERLSTTAEAALDTALELARAEVRRTPLLDLGDQIRAVVAEERLRPSPALGSLTALLDQLALLDEHGRWGSTFAERERLRLHIAGGRTSEGMSHLDWGLWWALLEELDRLQPLEVGTA